MDADVFIHFLYACLFKYPKLFMCFIRISSLWCFYCFILVILSLFCVYIDLLRCLMYMILICVYFTMCWVRDDLINEFNHVQYWVIMHKALSVWEDDPANNKGTYRLPTHLMQEWPNASTGSEGWPSVFGMMLFKQHYETWLTTYKYKWIPWCPVMHMRQWNKPSGKCLSTAFRRSL